MSSNLNYFNQKIDVIDKVLLLLILSIPFFLATSIFMADFFGSISSLILIYIIIKNKNNKIFKSIKKEIIFFSFLYLIILISLIFSNYFKDSFLASFFYFRYFLVSLSIFYLLTKHDFLIKFFYNSILITLSLVITDAFIQKIFGYNLFGYKQQDILGDLAFVTSFFNEEKKLGSYLVRFTPLMLSLIYFVKGKKSFSINILILISSGIAIFFASERTALLLYLIIIFHFIIISKQKIRYLLLFIAFMITLFSFNEDLKNKYVYFSIHQLTNSTKDKNDTHNSLAKIDSENKIIRYYSEEHENLSYTSLIIFKNNFLLGSGVKTFYQECSHLSKKEKYKNIINKRNNKLICSTHPHNTYLQLLSDIGIIGFLMVSYFFLIISLSNIKILFNKQKNKNIYTNFYINIAIFVNILPLIPAGSIFNNWISIMLYYSIGFWLFFKNQINVSENIKS